MKPILLVAFVSLVACSFAAGLAACSVDPTPEPVVTSGDALREKGGGHCGPVRYEGYAEADTKGDAYGAAEKSARQICFDTPTFCAVDCGSAKIVAADCEHYVVNDDPKRTEYYACTVTISAQ